jgi:hypothetical protein
MSTANTLTDQLNLVQREEARGILRLFTRQRSVSDGYCLAVFRKEEYRGSILSNEVVTEGDIKRRTERLGVRDGDTILRINLGSRPLTIRDTLNTYDGYSRFYTLDIEIAVNDPRSFAQRYLQSSDPVNLARIAIEGYLQRQAAREIHDELNDEMLRNYAERALRDGSNRSFGIQVVSAHKLIILMDPRRSKELEIEQQAQLKEKEIREQSRVKQIETQEEADIRKAGVRRDAEVKRLETEYEQELQAYLLEEQLRQRKVSRIDEVKEKDHQNLLDARKNDFLRLEEGKEREAKREQELLDDEQEARRAILKIQKAGEQRKVTRIYELEEQEHQQVYQIEEQARQLQLESTRAAHTRRETLLNTVGANSINALSERINQMIEDGRALDEVFNEHPEFREIFQIPGRLGKQDIKQDIQKEPLRIEEATNRNRPASTTNERSGVSRANTTPQPTPDRQETTSQPFSQVTGTLPGILRQPNDTINITDLGITLIQTQLSATQHEIAATHTPTAFLVSALDEHGPARRAQISTGDIVIEINGEEPRDIQSISRILQAYKPGSSVSLCILRGEDLKNVDI